MMVYGLGHGALGHGDLIWPWPNSTTVSRTAVRGTRGPDMMATSKAPHHRDRHVTMSKAQIALGKIRSTHYYIRALCCALAVGVVGEGKRPVIRGYGVC
jgi:hypothetical protein